MLDLSNKRYGERGSCVCGCAVIPEPTVDNSRYRGRPCNLLNSPYSRDALLSFSTRARHLARRRKSPRPPLARQKAEEQLLKWRRSANSGRHRPALRFVVAQGADQPRRGQGQRHGPSRPEQRQHRRQAGAVLRARRPADSARPPSPAPISRGASEDDILGVAAILGLQAIDIANFIPTKRDGGRHLRPGEHSTPRLFVAATEQNGKTTTLLGLSRFRSAADASVHQTRRPALCGRGRKAHR